MSPPPPDVESSAGGGVKVRVVDVWAHNQEAEQARILARDLPIVAVAIYLIHLRVGYQLPRVSDKCERTHQGLALHPASTNVTELKRDKITRAGLTGNSAKSISTIRYCS